MFQPYREQRLIVGKFLEEEKGALFGEEQSKSVGESQSDDDAVQGFRGATTPQTEQVAARDAHLENTVI